MVSGTPSLLPELESEFILELPRPEDLRAFFYERKNMTVSARIGDQIIRGGVRGDDHFLHKVAATHPILARFIRGRVCDGRPGETIPREAIQLAARVLLGDVTTALYTSFRLGYMTMTPVADALGYVIVERFAGDTFLPMRLHLAGYPVYSMGLSEEIARSTAEGAVPGEAGFPDIPDFFRLPFLLYSEFGKGTPLWPEPVPTPTVDPKWIVDMMGYELSPAHRRHQDIRIASLDQLLLVRLLGETCLRTPLALALATYLLGGTAWLLPFMNDELALRAARAHIPTDLNAAVHLCDALGLSGFQPS